MFSTTWDACPCSRPAARLSREDKAYLPLYKRWLGWMIVIAVLCPIPAAARPLVAVLPFGAATLTRQGVIKLLRERYDVVARLSWSAPSQSAAPPTGKPEPGAPLDAIVKGEITKNDASTKWTIHLSTFHAPTGRRMVDIYRPLTGPTPNRMVVLGLAEELFTAVGKAIAGPPPPPTAEQLQPPPRATPRSSAHSPYIETDVGFVLGMRRFTFAEEAAPSEVRCYGLVPPTPGLATQSPLLRYSPLSRCPGFNLAAAPGLRLDITLYPLAMLSIAPLRGLGLGMTLDWMLWPPGRTCSRNAAGGCATLGEELAVGEYRLEAGLRWRWGLPRPWPTPSISIQYGMHHFSVQPEQASYSIPTGTGQDVARVTVDDNHGLPDVTYQYLDLGLGVKVPYLTHERLIIDGELQFHYHMLFSHGDIEQTFTDNNHLLGGYGPVSSSFGWRLMATPLQLKWRAPNSRVPGWLRVQVSAYVENFSMTFLLADGDSGNSLPPLRRDPEQGARYIARSAGDWYFGAITQVGYQF